MRWPQKKLKEPARPGKSALIAATKLPRPRMVSPAVSSWLPYVLGVPQILPCRLHSPDYSSQSPRPSPVHKRGKAEIRHFRCDVRPSGRLAGPVSVLLGYAVPMIALNMRLGATALDVNIAPIQFTPSPLMNCRTSNWLEVVFSAGGEPFKQRVHGRLTRPPERGPTLESRRRTQAHAATANPT